jgi:iron complex outermembrane recepter protein
MNDPCGLLNIVTKNPLPEPYYAGEFTAGNYGGYRPTLDISGPLTQGKSLQYRLNAAYQRDGRLP